MALEVVQAFFKDKDEVKFLQSCADLGIEYNIIEENAKKRVYRIERIADVYYFIQKKDVSVIYFVSQE